MKTNKISTKIKTLGALFIFLMATVLLITVYLNNKNKKDALIINIAGKERMLTQKMSKSIFYLYHSGRSNFSELNSAVEEFIQNLNSLKNGNRLTGITPVPNENIGQQLYKVEILWKDFYNNINKFKELHIKDDLKSKKELLSIVDTIYNTNNELLYEVDNLVTKYTLYAESKTESIKYFQYLAAIIIITLIFYSFSQLKHIEDSANKLLEFSKRIAEEENTELKTIQIDANEKEIIEVTDTFNCFINKVNLAVSESAVAMEHSKNASAKLEEITDEFDKILGELENSKDINNSLNKSEDMIIQSTEDLMNSTKKLQELKKELDKLTNSCKTKS